MIIILIIELVLLLVALFYIKKYRAAYKYLNEIPRNTEQIPFKTLYEWYDDFYIIGSTNNDYGYDLVRYSSFDPEQIKEIIRIIDEQQNL